MISYELVALVLGAAFLLAALLPRLLKGSPVSLPMVYVGSGMLLSLLMTDAPRADPVAFGVLTERLAELAVIVSLMSAGLKLDRRLGWRRWGSTWRLLAVTMPLSIAALAVGGVWALGLPLAAAVLLGAAAAPTDPVLASSVQVGPPGTGDHDDVRFALTSEAGLNDGLAFPFVNLAIVLAVSGPAHDALLEWGAIDVAWKIVAGTAMGGGVGYVIALMVFRRENGKAVSDGFLAVALTLIAYGATELVDGYGFIGVFVAGLVFRRYEQHHASHEALHAFSEQVERLLMAALLVIFGASITDGLLTTLTWEALALGITFLVVIRPVAGLVGLLGSPIPHRQRVLVAVFGIRGIGTFYYLAHGLNSAEFAEPYARTLWAVAGVIILGSIILHGATAPHLFRHREE